jgi:hypothetical protein
VYLPNRTFTAVPPTIGKDDVEGEYMLAIIEAKKIFQEPKKKILEFYNLF